MSFLTSPELNFLKYGDISFSYWYFIRIVLIYCSVLD